VIVRQLTCSSALLVDPRTTLLREDFERVCQQSNIELLTIDCNYYLIHFLSPFFSLLDKQWLECNRLDRMFFKSPNDLRRIIYSIWFALRTLKRDEQVCHLFEQTCLWRTNDQLYRQTLHINVRTPMPKKKKKKLLVKTGIIS
jgi:hypothetical protein